MTIKHIERYLNILIIMLCFIFGGCAAAAIPIMTAAGVVAIGVSIGRKGDRYILIS